MRAAFFRRPHGPADYIPLALVIAALALSAPFLFLDLRLFRWTLLGNQLWNAGHIPLFFTLTWLWLRFRKWPAPLRPARIALETLAFGTAVGLCIEIVQVYTGRSFSLDDLLRNACGTLLALVFVDPTASLMSQSQRLKARLAVVCINVLILTSLWISIADRIVRHYQYPVLAHFETPLETVRWSINTPSRIINTGGERGRVLEVTLQPRAGYNKIDLMHFHPDWSDSRAVSLDVHNTATVSRTLNIRIHDQVHARGRMESADRYNNTYNLRPGWNRIVIATDDIKNAPERRAMDLTRIVNLQLFKRGLRNDWVVQIDNVKLIP